MTGAPDILAFDHVHVFVRDRDAAQAWYECVLGFGRTPELEFWAADGGPLTIQNASGTVHLALFQRGEREPPPCRSTIALRVTAPNYLAWREHLARLLPGAVGEEDHAASMSLYFRDPDGNPYEVTTYDCATVKGQLNRAPRAAGPSTVSEPDEAKTAMRGDHLPMTAYVVNELRARAKP